MTLLGNNIMVNIIILTLKYRQLETTNSTFHIPKFLSHFLITSNIYFILYIIATYQLYRLNKQIDRDPHYMNQKTEIQM